MTKFLLLFLRGYLILDNQYVGPVLRRINEININYGVATLLLSDGSEHILSTQKVYFTKFFANRALKKQELELAKKLAEDNPHLVDSDVMELEL